MTDDDASGPSDKEINDDEVYHDEDEGIYLNFRWIYKLFLKMKEKIRIWIFLKSQKVNQMIMKTMIKVQLNQNNQVFI